MARAAQQQTRAKAADDADQDEGRFAPSSALDGEVMDAIETSQARLPVVGNNDLDSSLAVALSEAEINQQIATAKRYPRGIQQAVDNITMLATLDTPTAIECNYALPRGRDDHGKAKTITGPSIRFAELAAQQWGNNRIAARIIAVDRKEKYVEAEGIYHDLETNTAVAARVRRRISGKSGNLYNEDMILVTGNAATSIALRNAILRGIPKPVWRKAYAAVVGVIAGDVKTIALRRVDLLKAFKDDLGIKPAQVYAILSVKGENDIGPDEIVVASGFYSALRNNEITVDDLLREAKGPQPNTKTLAGAFSGADGNSPEAGKAPGGTSAPKASEPAQEKKPEPEATKHDEDGVVQEGDEDGEAMGDGAPTTEGTESTEAEEEQGASDWQPGDERQNPAAFLAWAPTANADDRKAAFIALSRTAGYKALPEEARDMVAAAVEGQAPAAPADQAPKKSDQPPPPKEERPKDAVDVFWDAVDGQESWTKIKHEVSILYKSDDWKIAMNADDQRAVRIEIWEFVDGLLKAKKDSLDFATDPSAFRLWMEWINDADAIEGNFRVLQSEPAWAKMNDTNKEALTAAVRARIAELRTRAG